jgi:hypothetical protein
MDLPVKSLIVLSAFSAAMVTQASTVSITFNSNAVVAESAFVTSLNGPTVVENFNSLGGAYVNGGIQQKSWESKSASYNTNVGTFTLITPGQVADDNVFNNELMIESTRTGEYGRESLAQATDDLWLDSNDAELVEWTLGSPLSGSFNALGFYLADADDVGGYLTITFTDNSSTTLSLFSEGDLPNSNLAYVSIVSDQSILNATITFDVRSLANPNLPFSSDGWGIDDVTIGNVPEPTPLLLTGIGLVVLGISRRKLL